MAKRDMAIPKLFLTGTTGYIGGDALHAINSAHPDWQYTCLVRNSDKGAKVAMQHPSVRLVYGDLNDAALIEEEAKRADIVLHFADNDHVTAANAISAGLSSTSGAWIHTSGAGILMYPDLDIGSYGNSSNKIWDDIKDLDAITSIPDHSRHRDVDKIVLTTGSGGEGKVKTAIVCPPNIYGVGRGPDNTRSMQMPELARQSMLRQEGFMIGDGETRWSNVHVHDLSDLYLALAEAAVEGKEGVSWGAEGYYFAENGENQWGTTSAVVAQTAHDMKLMSTNSVVSLSPETVGEMVPWGPALWGANSRSRASRARKELQWNPSRTLDKFIKEVIEVEARSLGKLK